MKTISLRKGRKVTASIDGDRLLIIEREKEYDKWGEYRITLTIDEINKILQWATTYPEIRVKSTGELAQ